MFKKPVRIKSNTQTKGSERKNFKDLLLKSFPRLRESDINELLPKREALNVLKVCTYDDSVLHVYTIQKTPMIFDVKGKVFPTVFLLWKFPHLISAFTTHQQVMNFISSGADLMLPGVLTPPQQSGLPKYACVSENDIVYVNFSNNQAAVAVGVASQNSNAMMLSNGRGKCVHIYHFYGDSLCTAEGMANIPIPNLGSPDWLKFKDYDTDFPALGTTRGEPIQTLSAPSYDIQANDETEESTEDSSSSTENVDELLLHCFLGALKYSKGIELPVLTSIFYKLHMLPMCPPNKNLDIKKSSYKKLKPFLEDMVQQGLITIHEVKKGVESITSIIRDHPKYTSFYIEPQNRPKEDNEKENIQTTDVIESYIVTPAVLPIFESAGFKKGNNISGPEVRRCISKYIKDNSLQDEKNSRLVIPRHVLAEICKTNNPMVWEEVIEKICNSMKHCYKVKSGNEEIFNKGKVSPIALTVSMRSGNKKVTLVDNLELFGIKINEFAKECQHGVAASTSIARPPGKKTDQLLVQGNQVLFVYNILTEKYKVPKKYIKGLENAPKKKK